MKIITSLFLKIIFVCLCLFNSCTLVYTICVVDINVVFTSIKQDSQIRFQKIKHKIKVLFRKSIVKQFIFIFICLTI